MRPIINVPEEDWATDTGNMRKKFGKEMHHITHAYKPTGIQIILLHKTKRDKDHNHPRKTAQHLVKLFANY